MNEAGQMVLNWLAELPVAIQIGLSLVIVFLIAPAFFAALVAAITKLEERLEALISRRCGSSPIAGTPIPENPSEPVPNACIAQDSAAYPDPVSQTPARRSDRQLRRIHPAE
jgi:hypothetical protein